MKVISLKKLAILAGLLFATQAFASIDPTPHFDLQMFNNSAIPVTVNFIPHGNVYLQPDFQPDTLLAAGKTTDPYGVVFPNLFDGSYFDVVFTGKHDCTFTVKYFAPGDPQVSMKGLGCLGGGYNLNQEGIVLYISGINSKD